MTQKFRLALRKLDWISPVDEPAQQTAKVKLIKGANLAARARVVKTSDELGLVFCWAFTTDVAGEPYFDLQGDAIVADDSFVKAAADFMADGGGTDEMHDGEADGRVVFCMPMTADVAKAFDIETDTHGLMVALKPSPEVFEKFKSGEYTGVSIAGFGEREQVSKVKCAKCSSYMAKDADACPQCKAAKRVTKGDWSTATVDDFPDSSFLYVEGGGSKDSSGKTTPRSLRHFPYRDENGKIDLPHLRDAIGRIPQSSLPATLRNKLQVKAEKLLAAQHQSDAAKRAPDPSRVLKHAYLTTAVDGHTHLLDHDNGQAAGYTEYAYIPGDPDGYHCHPWTRNSALDTFVLGEAAGHVHEVIPQEQIDALVASGDADVDEDDAAKRAPLSKGNAMKDADIADLKKKLEKRDADIARLEKKYSMTDAQRAHYRSIEKREDKDAFLDMSMLDRDAAVAKALEADPVIVELDGVSYRKSAGEATIAIVKRAKDTAEALAKRDAELVDERLQKRASVELAKHGGKIEDKVALLKALDAVPEANRAGVKAIVKAGHDAIAKGFESFGHGPKPADGMPEGISPQEQLEALVKQHAEKNNVEHAVAYGAVLKTTDGKRLYAQAEAAKRN